MSTTAAAAGAEPAACGVPTSKRAKCHDNPRLRVCLFVVSLEGDDKVDIFVTSQAIVERIMDEHSYKPLERYDQKTLEQLRSTECDVETWPDGSSDGEEKKTILACIEEASLAKMGEGGTWLAGQQGSGWKEEEWFEVVRVFELNGE